jgi:predicted RNA-binding Zn-ribbon protein involved in translation (DUF1610 family)
MGVAIVEPDLKVLDDFAIMFMMSLPCEYAWHGKLGHTGPAEWSIDASCPQCGDTKRGRLFCDPCKNIAQSAGEVQCDECGLVALVGAFWKNVRKL